jgi:hypothetical protein
MRDVTEVLATMLDLENMFPVWTAAKEEQLRLAVATTWWYFPNIIIALF